MSYFLVVGKISGKAGCMAERRGSRKCKRKNVFENVKLSSNNIG